MSPSPNAPAGLVSALLEHLEDGGFHSSADLARQLGVSEALVEAMIADLARRGYLRPATAACSGACAGCPFAGSCSLAGLGRGWELAPPSERPRSGRSATD